MAKKLEIAEALSARTVNELSEKQKIIQEQAKLIEEKEKEGSSDALRAKCDECLNLPLSSFTVRVDSTSSISSLLDIPSWDRSFFFRFS